MHRPIRLKILFVLHSYIQTQLFAKALEEALTSDNGGKYNSVDDESRKNGNQYDECFSSVQEKLFLVLIRSFLLVIR